MSRLSDSQLVVLTAACQRADRCVFPVTARLKGNAAGNVLKSLLKQKLIDELPAQGDDTVWRHDEQQGGMTLVATDAAFAALGIDIHHDGEPRVKSKQAAPKAASSAKPNKRPKAPKSKAAGSVATHEGTKQSQLIDLLRRPKGATIDEIAEALSWQPHTVRGAIAGALKKKLGLDVTSEKDEKRGRIYRIQNAD